MLHPPILLALFENSLAIFINFYTSTTCVAKQFSTINTSANSCKKVKFFDV